MDNYEDIKKRRQSVNESFNRPIMSEETKAKIKGFFGSEDKKPDPLKEAFKKQLDK